MMPTTDEYHDHRRDLAKHEPRANDHLSTRQHIALLMLVGYLEGLVGTGLFGETVEMSVRSRLVEVELAFDIPTKAEGGI